VPWQEWRHLIVACLLHDIGDVRGVLRGDTDAEFVVDEGGKTVTLPRGASDAALMPYHIECSKLFVHARPGKSPTIDAARVAKAIEFTRFPVPAGRNSDRALLEPRLVQAADLIGQLGDPGYPVEQHWPPRSKREESSLWGMKRRGVITMYV
jgi:hypothetical protein